jgi:hypothetical protein
MTERPRSQAVQSFGPAGDGADGQLPAREGVADGPLARGGVAGRPPEGDVWTGVWRRSRRGMVRPTSWERE